FPLGTTPVTWTATDAAGNGASCTQMVTIADAEPPVVTCGGAVDVDAGASCDAAPALSPPSATDNCGAASVAGNAPARFPDAATPVAWTATGGSGNTSSCPQPVTVHDRTPPAIVCPDAVSTTTDASCGATANLGHATATDNCGGALSVSNDAPATLPLGTT